ncbi:hypothetical protein EYC84_005622 [Monilinia fructicola]|uniref:Uncharacterized protein n=1 Tax=Monilinia fructicola TaxID=38448 RepID=A0A5M9JZL6_MONFR|nr:hypothetical protein EYC84_005622 [Monilinia fructicola]
MRRNQTQERTKIILHEEVNRKLGCIVLHNHCKIANQKTPDQNGYRLHCSQLSAAIPELVPIESSPCNQVSLPLSRYILRACEPFAYPRSAPKSS